MKKLFILFAVLLPAVTYSSTRFKKIEIKKTESKKDFALELLRIQAGLDMSVSRNNGQLLGVIVGETGYMLWDKAPALSELASSCDVDHGNFEDLKKCQSASLDLTRFTDILKTERGDLRDKLFPVLGENLQGNFTEIKTGNVLERSNEGQFVCSHELNKSLPISPDYVI